jgi:hypothetical protein
MLKKPGAGATPATSSSTPSQTPIKSPDVAPMAVDTPQVMIIFIRCLNHAALFKLI